MNNLIQLKGQLLQKKFPSKPGPSRLPAGIKIETEHLEEKGEQ